MTLLILLALFVLVCLASMPGSSAPPTFFLLLALGLLATLWTGASPTAVVRSTSDTAVVRPDRAEFIFAPAQHETWEWNRSATRGVEYAWFVRVQSGDAGHELGAYLLTKLGPEPKHGSLAELIAACRQSVARLSDHRAELIGSCQVSVDGQNRVHVVLTEAPTIARIFPHKPAHVVMVITAPGEPTVERNVAVVYQGW